LLSSKLPRQTPLKLTGIKQSLRALFQAENCHRRFIDVVGRSVFAAKGQLAQAFLLVSEGRRLRPAH
jgi:hypothetical protein